MMIQGKAFWAKVDPAAPVKNKFNERSKQWSFDLSVDEKVQAELLEAGMRQSYLRDKSDERGVFLTFVRDATKVDGNPGKPFDIIDAHGNPWPSSKKIGNGSILNVIVTLNERQFRGEKFLKPSALKMQIWEEVPYDGPASFPTKETSGTDDSESDVTNSDKNW